jgi:hypothetical protein
VFGSRGKKFSRTFNKMQFYELNSFLQIERYDENNVPALICAICLKDLLKAISFRNKAIKAEKYFKGSDESEFAQFVEPEVHIKLEEDVDFDKIKSEPIDEDPSYEFVDENPTASTSSFVDVFETKPSTEFYDYNERSDRKKKTKSERYGLDDFCSSSGVVRCNLCMKTFTSVNSHQNHLKTVHRSMSAAEMHKCKYCNRFFKLKIYLNRHVARIHGNISLQTTKGRQGSKKKSTETIFDKEDVSLYCEVS